MTEVKNIVLVADYGKDDLAFKEVTQRLYEQAAEAGEAIHVDIVSVDSFDTAQTAAVVAQIAEKGTFNGRKVHTVYHNTAPRRDEDKERVNNDGEFLAYAAVQADTGNTVQVVGVYSGNEKNVNTFALLNENRHQGVFRTTSDTDGSQFRSRDKFPPYVIAALNGTIELTGAALAVPQPLDANLVGAAWQKAFDIVSDAEAHQFNVPGDTAKGYITVIADPANIREVLTNVAATANGAEIDAIPLKSEPPHWVEASFIAGQLALNATRPQGRTLISLKNSRSLESAAFLFEGELDNGSYFISDAVEDFGLVADRLKHGNVKFYLGSPSHSISFTEQGVPVIAGQSTLTSVADIKSYTAIHDTTIAYRDGYGNLKLAGSHTNLLQQRGLKDTQGEWTLQAGERAYLKADIGGTEHEALVASGSFSVPNNTLAFSAGSSGWNLTATPDDGRFSFAELFWRGGSAAKEFAGVNATLPGPGNKVTILLTPEIRQAPPTPTVAAKGATLTGPAHGTNLQP
jgi:hypothetical protein